MDVYLRGLQGYLLLLAFVGAVGVVWGANIMLGNTTAGTGWPVMVGLAIVLIVLGVILRRVRPGDDRPPLDTQYPWSDRDR